MQGSVFDRERYLNPVEEPRHHDWTRGPIIPDESRYRRAIMPEIRQAVQSRFPEIPILLALTGSSIIGCACSQSDLDLALKPIKPDTDVKPIIDYIKDDLGIKNAQGFRMDVDVFPV